MEVEYSCKQTDSEFCIIIFRVLLLSDEINRGVYGIAIWTREI